MDFALIFLLVGVFAGVILAALAVPVILVKRRTSKQRAYALLSVKRWGPAEMDAAHKLARFLGAFNDAESRTLSEQLQSRVLPQ